MEPEEFNYVGHKVIQLTKQSLCLFGHGLTGFLI